jgi:hypothetical protein
MSAARICILLIGRCMFEVGKIFSCARSSLFDSYMAVNCEPYDICFADFFELFYPARVTPCAILH